MESDKRDFTTVLYDLLWGVAEAESPTEAQLDAFSKVAKILGDYLIASQRP